MQDPTPARAHRRALRPLEPVPAVEPVPGRGTPGMPEVSDPAVTVDPLPQPPPCTTPSPYLTAGHLDDERQLRPTMRKRWARIWPSLLAAVTLPAVGGPAAVASYRHARGRHRRARGPGDGALARSHHRRDAAGRARRDLGSAPPPRARGGRAVGSVLGRHGRDHRRQPRRGAVDPGGDRRRALATDLPGDHTRADRACRVPDQAPSGHEHGACRVLHPCARPCPACARPCPACARA